MKEKEIMTITIRVLAKPDGIHHAVNITGIGVVKDAANLYVEALESFIPEVGEAAEKLIARAIKNKGRH
ncbi:hypothetical protein I2494_15520 [Budviciaceae bacterium BWR-B9]|uniref:Uncharacterized protein n=1 Tax=Limnobaculum allomyrinae TaxID=2791986 RepID=A0ABS1ITJ6_9GAMM|nr:MULTISPECIES: hypothetical protein [Limnobaculum]MBK5145098.1 hypothetical protein [Limnobaculum allomyrinae]MBV7692929.1 hypothetical protein [Limnobaculum sp. M2-1]